MACEIYVPIPSCESVNLIQMESIQKTLKEAHRTDAPEKIEFNLSIVDSNTTVSHYKLTQGMVSLDSLR